MTLMKTPTKQQGSRIPRPIGTTGIGFNHYKDPSQQNKQRLEEHLITHFLTNNFTYCNKHYNIEQLSILLNITTQRILGHTIQYGHNIQGQMDALTSGDSLRALLALGIKATLDDRGRALEQYSILAASQGGKYKAFISGEVNRALKLVMESGQGITATLKALSGGTSINILNATTPLGTKEGTQEYVTIDDAIMHIKDAGIMPLALNEAQQQSIFLSNGIGDTPEVNALKQEGVDTSKEALDLVNITDFKDEVLEHSDRRAKEEDFDLDADEV